MVKIEACAFNLTLSWTLCYWQELALLTISYVIHYCQKVIITATMCQTSRRKNYLGVRKKACNIHKSRLVDSKKHGKLTQCRDWGVRTRNWNIWKGRPFQSLPFGVTWDPKKSWEVTFCYICFYTSWDHEDAAHFLGWKISVVSKEVTFVLGNPKYYMYYKTLFLPFWKYNCDLFSALYFKLSPNLIKLNNLNISSDYREK